MNKGLYLFIFILVFIKKWEPGGHIDATWYASIGKNIAITGDYFHFMISPVYEKSVWDHFPLSYWIMGWMMRMFGQTDLVARFYFMICSAFSYFLVFKLGEKFKDRAFGFSALVTLALCIFYGKWSGGIKHDVPLVLGYLGVVCFFLRGLEKPIWFFAVGPFLAFAVFSKGPVAAGVLGGLGLWLVITRQWQYLKTREFWGGMILAGLLLLLPYLPQFRFDGMDYYTLFRNMKRSYFTLSRGTVDYPFYTLSLFARQLHIIPFFLIALYLTFSNRLGWSQREREYLWLCWCMMVAVIVPFSLFEVQFAYYILPAYPFFALFSAQTVYWLWTRYRWNWSNWLAGFSVTAMMLFLTFPIKTTGDRPKNNLNIINVLKFDADIDRLPVYFLGHYNEDNSIFQEYKFYGNINLVPLKRERLAEVLAGESSYLIVRQMDLPVVVGEAKTLTSEDCFVATAWACAIAIHHTPKLNMPTKEWPHEVYH